MRRIALKGWQKVLIGVAGLVFAAIAGITFAITQTGYGRERVRLFVIDRLAGSVHGTLTLGRVRGNLLSGARIDGVVITDSTGRPFLQADTVILRYRLLSFLRKRLFFRDVRVVHPTVVIDRRPGRTWNFAALFAGDSTRPRHEPPGFGAWIRIDRLTVVRGDVSVRDAGTHPEVLSTFSNVEGFFPMVLWSDPASTVRVVDIGNLSTRAQFRNPAPAEVRDLSGHVTIGADSVGFRDLHVTLPGSRLTVTGNYSMSTTDVNAVIHAESVQFEDLRFATPDLPGGNGRGDVALTQAGDFRRLVATNLELHAEGSHVQGAFDLQLRPVARANGSNLSFQGVDTRVIRKFAPKVDVPVDGVLDGHLQLAGTPGDLTVGGWTSIRDRQGETSRITANGTIASGSGSTFVRPLRLQFDPVRMSLLRTLRPGMPLGGAVTGHAVLNGDLSKLFSIDADVVHADSATGTSHVLAAGDISIAKGFSSHNLALRLEPLQVAVLRAFQPTLPVDGIITGTATLNGSPKDGIAARLDIVHEGSTGMSRLGGDAAVTFTDVLQQLDLDLRATPLSLATAGRFAPGLGLQATATGTIAAHGPRDSIQFTTELTVPQGGLLLAQGSFGLGDPVRYEVHSTLQHFDPSTISTHSPATLLNGAVNATGCGVTLATAVASIDVALADPRAAEHPGTDSTRLVARLDGGLATVDRGHIRFASAVADIDGSFGLVDGRSGTLNYRVAIDTLSRIAQFAERDTTSVQPRPAPQARRFAQARADSIRIARQTEVERAATGKPAEPALKVDSLKALPRDSVAGIIRASGTLVGSITRFGAEGTATLNGVQLQGNQVQSGSLAYTVARAPGVPLNATLHAAMIGVQVAGFVFDSAHVALDHAGDMSAGEGKVDLAVFQEPGGAFRVKSGFVFAPDRKELRLTDISLRLDSTLWSAAQPGAVTWGASGIGLHTIDLRDGHGGRIFADGTLPSEGSGDLQIAIDSLQIGDITALLQDTLTTRGMLSLHARFHGTAREPLASGTIVLDSTTRGGARLPDLHGTFEYAGTRLTANAQFVRGARQLLDAKVQLPVDLALSGHKGPRFLDGPLSVDARMDSLPLDALPGFTGAVQDLRGAVDGTVAVRGTFKDPVLTGSASLTHGSVRIVEPGITLADGTATFTFRDRQIVVDSFVATSGGGRVRASGTLEVSRITHPGFDLQFQATNALLLNGKWGKINANAAIAAKGPYDAVQVTGTIAMQSGTVNAPEQTAARRATDLDDPTLVAVLDSLAVPAAYRPAAPSEFLKNLRVDVGVTIAHDTWVRNSSMNVEIYTADGGDPLHVRMDSAGRTFTLEGTINADRGEYTVAGRPFKLTTGSVTFLGTADFDPTLQLSGQYEVPRRNSEALTILINVGGYLHAPRLTLSSNAQPPLPQSDLISYLAFGRTSTSLLSPEGSGLGGVQLGIIAQQQLAGLGLGAFTDGFVRDFERQGRRAGLDVFRIHPGTMPDELAYGGYFQNFLRSTQVEAGQYISPRLFAALEARATPTWPGLRLEYESRGGFSWRATWEPRYLPVTPSLAEVNAATLAQQTRVLGAFLFWIRRF